MTECSAVDPVAASDRKRQLRRECIRRRSEFTGAPRAEAEARIRRQALELLAEVLANAPPSAAIGLYAPVRGEVDVLPLLADIVSHGWMAALPRVEGPGDMAFRQITRVDELRPGAYGIPEPGPDCPRVAPVDLTALIVPGVAFARDGRRLGYGGGYYDRWLAAEQVRAVRIGIAFELQVLDELPAEAHDVRMHYLVTERGVFRCGGQP